MWLSAAHIPGTQNIRTGSFSKIFSEAVGWKLSSQSFQKISNIFGNPTLDLFASHISYQNDKYISLKPDPKAIEMFFQSNGTLNFIISFPLLAC